MTAIAQASGGAFTVDLRTDPTGLDAAALAPYDALVFFTCGDLPADHPLRPALLAFVAGGKGFVGFHSATDSFYSWPEYGDFIGARFVNHGSENLPGTIRVEDPNHVAMQGFTNPFSFTEEFYLFRGPERHVAVDSFTRRDLHVLMNLDPATPTPARPTAAAAVPAARGDRPPAGLDAPARRRPRVLFGLRPSAGDLGQPAVPRPRGRGDPLGAVRRRRRRPERRLGTVVGAARLRRDRRQRGARRPGRRRPDECPGTARRHPPARLRAALSRRRRDEHLLRDADQRPQPEPDVHVPRAAALSARRRHRPDRPGDAGAALAPDDDPAARRGLLDAAGLGSARRRRPHDDLGPQRRPLRQPRRVVARRPRARLVLRRRRHPRPLRPVLPGAEPERSGRRSRRPLPARSGRRRRARDPPLHGRRAPAPDDQRRLHPRARGRRRGRRVPQHERHADHRRARDVQEPRQRAVDGRHRRHRRHHARHQLVPGRRRHRGVLRHVRAGGQPVAGAGADPRDVPAAVRRAAGAARLRHSGAAAPDDPRRAGGSGARRDLGLDRDHVHGAGRGRAIDVVARRRLVRRTRHARDQHHGHGVGGRRRPERHRRPRPHLPAGGERRQPDERLAARDSGPRRRAAASSASTPTR